MTPAADSSRAPIAAPDPEPYEKTEVVRKRVEGRDVAWFAPACFVFTLAMLTSGLAYAFRTESSAEARELRAQVAELKSQLNDAKIWQHRVEVALDRCAAR